MLGVSVQIDETNGRVCLFQMDNLEWDTKLEWCRASVKYLIGKGANVDDAKGFDQTCNLKQFVESYLTGRRIH